MDKKNNMKQAMYEMFGVGAAPEQNAKTPDPDLKTIPDESSNAPGVHVKPQPKAAASYLAPGTVMEGTLRCVGDVEIAGDFKGDITTQGTVILHASIQGNLSVSSLDLSGCKLTGDVVADDVVTISEGSEIYGNVTAKELRCGGRITGDLKISGYTVLDETARITGNVNTGTLSVVKGATIKGHIEINQAR